MEASSEPTPNRLANYVIKEKLGSGACADVFATHQVDKENQIKALKIFFRDEGKISEEVINEIQVQIKLDHPNILKAYEVLEKEKYLDANGRKRDVIAIVLEIINGLDLFACVQKQGGFTEPQCRTILEQFLKALEYLHSTGYCHRDIKPQNMFLNDKGFVKMADFGFANKLEGIQDDPLGTQGYKAPQIYKREYEGSSVDIFATGVTLYVLAAGNPPFSSSQIGNESYLKLATGKADQFWEDRKKDQNFQPSNDFKDLIRWMLEPTAVNRATIKAIRQHPWMKGQRCSQEELSKELKTRKQKNEEMKKKKKTKGGYKSFLMGGQGGTRSKHHDPQLQEIKKQIQQQKDERRKIPETKRTTSRDIVMDIDQNQLVVILRRVLNDGFEDKLRGITFKAQDIRVTGNVFEVSFTIQQTQGQLQLKLHLFKTPQGQMCIRFEQVEGNDFYLQLIKSNIEDEFSDCVVEQ